MAERRMFAKSIVLADQFTALPAKTQCLYYALGMNADDDGFVGNPKAVCRLSGATAKDLNLLRDKGYLLFFDSGVIAITHWRVSNTIRADRYKPSVYMKERSMVMANEAGEYVRFQRSGDMPAGIPDVTPLGYPM